jgi:hypothetical protein
VEVLTIGWVIEKVIIGLTDGFRQVVLKIIEPITVIVPGTDRPVNTNLGVDIPNKAKKSEPGRIRGQLLAGVYLTEDCPLAPDRTERHKNEKQR